MKIYNIKPEDYKIKIVMRGENMKLPTSIENRLNENIVENARLELKKKKMETYKSGRNHKWWSN